ncbi:MAG: hypothetical protein HQM02_02285 [Magnetococcales bacterium]|nr:hypothetical protein [Magnetococcales bacterium]
MNMRQRGGSVTLWLLVAWMIGGCGYRFPADRNANDQHGRWAQTHLTVEGVKTTLRSDAVLTRILDNILTTRMGPFASSPALKEARRLRVRLDTVNRDLILEDSSGRANQYRMTITAQPMLEMDGKVTEPGYPSVKGVATYYEPASGTASQAARIRAETEAMNQLADALVAVLAEDFQPGPTKP